MPIARMSQHIATGQQVGDLFQQEGITLNAGGMVRTADQGLAAQVLLQRGLQPETLNGGLVVPLDVGQARKR